MDNTELIELQNLLMQVVRESKSDVKDLNNRAGGRPQHLSHIAFEGKTVKEIQSLSYQFKMWI